VRRLLRRWWPVLLLAGLFAGLQAKLWLGAGGWREAQALQETVEAQRTENARLQQRNDALAAEVEDLKSGETAVEERARSELGMVKPGETFYRVVEPHPVAPVEGEAAMDESAREPGDAQHGEAAGPDGEPTQ
jgi:cell division protein FtsB